MPGQTDPYALPYPLPADPPESEGIQTLAERLAVVLAAFDSNVQLVASNGSTVNAVIPDGNDWHSVEAPVNVVCPKPGKLFVIGSAYLSHKVSSGDPRCQIIATSGPIAGQVVNLGRVGTGTTGGIEVHVSVPVFYSCEVTGPGTVALQRQVKHHIASGTGHEWGYFDVYAVFIGQADV